MQRFDARALYDALNAQRAARALSWAQVAAETGVSAATIKRTQAGGRMEVDGMLAMVAWLGERVETFVTPSRAGTLGVRRVVPLLAVRSMAASLRFYADGLGFRTTHRWVPEGKLRWCWLELDDTAMMLQEVVPPEKYTRELEGRAGLGMSLNFICRDALAFYHQVKARGIVTKRPFVGNRMWVTSLQDPDGYDLHFESPTDVPEETEYEG